MNVDGRMLYLTCQGEGSPTVVLEAGGTGNSTSWNPVRPDIAKFTRVCAYDRAGVGNSSSVPAHRSIEAMVRDLHALLDAGGINEPVVIVGHSFGGRLVRAFGSLYPDDVDKKLHQLLLTLHGELVALSANGTHITADDSGHWIQFDRPDLVVGAIRQLVVEVRNTGGR